jgi:hypothetical protein
MSLFQFSCAYGGNMIIIKLRFLKRRLGRQLVAAILGLPLVTVYWIAVDVSKCYLTPLQCYEHSREIQYIIRKTVMFTWLTQE